ncbi:MAG: cytidine/deoxycytidylate deaminase family protein [Thermodesulfobacteriota bacterium]|nr:cytidine/deoxycytidylate deaminase family protein [Thermodesulfobacteriota bacterium]
MERPSWEQYFIDIARLVSSRSTCLRRQVGAVVVKDKNVLTTGYNGTPSGIRHCIETGCLRDAMAVPSGERHELCRGLHAEQNAIIQAAKHGISIADGTLYCTHAPCVICAKMLINSGLEKIVYIEGYPDQLAADLLDESGIQIVAYNP